MRSRNSAPNHFYCRHDNRVVAACPRSEAIGQCPLRLECPAFTGQACPAVSLDAQH